MDCTFCAIISGGLSAHEVLRDDDVVAFLDRAPLFLGHVLVVPVLHRTTLAELDPDSVGPFFVRVQRVAGAVQDALDAHGTFVAINNTVSQSVAHLHAHVVPRRFKDGLRGFFWPRQRYSDENEASSVAHRIARRLGGHSAEASY